LGFLLRIKSFNELNLMIKAKEFDNLFPKGTKLPGIDVIRDTLKVIVMNGLRRMNYHLIKKSIINKVFDNGTIDGYIVVAIDGTKFFASNKKSCDECLKTNNHYFHSGAVIATVGGGPKLVLDFEMYKSAEDSATKDEGEQTVSKRLLSNVVNDHKGLIDVVVYDALVCNSVWFNHCAELGVDTVVRAKNNNNKSLRDVKKKVNKMDEVDVWDDEKGYENVKVYESTFKMDNVDRKLRYVKFLMKYPDGKRSQVMIVTTCMKMDLKTLFKIIRARWLIENSIFNNLKKECGLEHCFVHGGNGVEAVICLIFIASNLLQLFYHRRIKRHISTQRELVRLLLKGLYLLKKRSELIFDSG
jgi:predicted transposase YbfD/YdcC